MSPLAHRGTRLRRLVLGPAGATAIIVALSATAIGLGAATGVAGWSLAWLLLGLCAGYALSGSA